MVLWSEGLDECVGRVGSSCVDKTWEGLDLCVVFVMV